jgi:hypothetical protein
MARTTTPIVLLDTTLAAAGSGTKSAPGAATVTPYDNSKNYVSALTMYIENDTLAPGTPLTLAIQVTDDLAKPWVDYDILTGTTAAPDANALHKSMKTITLERVLFVRAIAYGNTSQPVKVRAVLHAVTGL